MALNIQADLVDGEKTTSGLVRLGAWMRALLAAIASCLLFTACKPQQLAWVNNANAQEIASRDTAQGNLRFFSVCGFSCVVPGVGTTNATLCYPKTVVHRIEGTSDGYGSEEELQLNLKARTFAEQYNLLVASQLQREKKSACDPSTDWDAGFHAMHQYVQSLSNKSNEEGLVALVVERSEFVVTMPPNVSLDQASLGLCERIRLHGLIGVAVVKLVQPNKPNALPARLNCAVYEAQKSPPQ